MRVILVLALLLTQAPADVKNKQAVVETDLGSFVIQLLGDDAPNHVASFMKLAREGVFNGTSFHHVVKYGIIQGGDTGHAATLKRETNTQKQTAGAVSAVLQPGKPDSAGAQFFVAVTDQPGLEGQYTVFGRVVDGIEVVQQLSAVDAEADGRPKARLTIKSVTIRDAPVDPFAAASAAELAGYRAVIDTAKGTISLDFLADKAPETVRNFLQLAAAGVFDTTLVHRVVANFVIQTGAPAYRQSPLTPAQQKLIHNLQPEFNDTVNAPGIVSMARGDDPASAQSSFFICTGECRSLDGKYTAFAKVTSGMDVVKAIEAVPVNGEAPREPVLVTKVRIEKK